MSHTKGEGFCHKSRMSATAAAFVEMLDCVGGGTEQPEVFRSGFCPVCSFRKIFLQSCMGDKIRNGKPGFEPRLSMKYQALPPSFWLVLYETSHSAGTTM